MKTSRARMGVLLLALLAAGVIVRPGPSLLSLIVLGVVAAIVAGVALGFAALLRWADRGVDPWSLASSIGLVIVGPWLLISIVGYETSGHLSGGAPYWFLGTVELTLLGMIWTVGVVLVVRSWLVRRGQLSHLTHPHRA